MAFRMSISRLARSQCLGVVALTGLLVLGLLAVTGSRSVADEVLTNDGVVKMVKAGLPESVIIQKIRTSERKLDTSADALIKLKSAGVPDKVIEAMLAPASSSGTSAATAPPASGAPSGSVQPTIAHVVGTDQKPLKSVLGSMEFKVQPFGGSRQEVVLPEPKAQYRITQVEPVFVSATPEHQWILVRLKPGKRDRNLPMSNSSGFWTYGGATFRQGVDPKYAIRLTSEPGPNGSTQLKPTEPLKPGEYGWVAASRGQINLNEVFDFAVD
jgi:hypothetical protein